jgi:flagellar protein FlaG
MAIQQLGSATGTVGLNPAGQGPQRSADAPPPAKEQAPPPPASQPTKAQASSLESVQQAMKQVAEAVQSKASNLQFSVDEGTGTTVIKVVDTQTKEVIRQIPSEEMLAIARSIEDSQGMLLKEKA